MKKYYNWIEEKKIIHNLNLDADGFEMSMHQYAGCGENWYLSTNRLSISMLDLGTTDLTTAKVKAIAFVKAYINNLVVELEKI